MHAPSIEILAVGNELLAGDVLDTNTPWLCRRLTRLGGIVRRVCQVPDEARAIGREARASVRRGADLLVVTGGLGPTADDRTLRALATAFRRPLEPNKEALAFVRERYRFFSKQGFVAGEALTAGRRKMARLPRGATSLANPVGAAPGVAFESGRATVVCLPGVPAELRGIFESSLQPILREKLGAAAFAERAAEVRCGDESALAPLLAKVSRLHPGVYLKSHPRRFGRDIRMVVTFSARGASPDDADRLVDATWRTLRERLKSAGMRATAKRAGAAS